MRFILTLCLFVSSAPLFAQSEFSVPTSSPQIKAPTPKVRFVVLNRDFVKYSKPKRVTPSQEPQVEVIYFYYYGSPWAQEIDTSLRTWAQTRPYNIKFITVPAYFNANPFGKLGARIHYTLEMMGESERLSPLFMRAVQTKRVDLQKMSSVLQWMENHQVDTVKFLKIINSNEVKSATLAIPQVLGRYEVKSTPTIVIDGQYLIESNEKRSPSRVLEITKFMADKLSEGGKRP